MLVNYFSLFMFVCHDLKDLRKRNVTLVYVYSCFLFFMYRFSVMFQENIACFFFFLNRDSQTMVCGLDASLCIFCLACQSFFLSTPKWHSWFYFVCVCVWHFLHKKYKTVIDESFWSLFAFICIEMLHYDLVNISLLTYFTFFLWNETFKVQG